MNEEMKAAFYQWEFNYYSVYDQRPTPAEAIDWAIAYMKEIQKPVFIFDNLGSWYNSDSKTCWIGGQCPDYKVMKKGLALYSNPIFPDNKAQVPNHLIERIEHHRGDSRNTAFARSTLGEVLNYLEAEDK